MQGNIENTIVLKSFEFALKLIENCKLLVELKKNVTTGQVLISVKSIVTNVPQAQNT
jgi:hypothetical protein